jgi:hypothetical protein
MLKRLSFKKYLETKDLLRKSIEKVPVVTAEYVINKYCSLTINENERIPLKPNSRILVDWEYKDIKNPQHINIRFEGVRNKDPYDDNIIGWSSNKLQKWLKKNTRKRI